MYTLKIKDTTANLNEEYFNLKGNVFSETTELGRNYYYYGKSNNLDSIRALKQKLIRKGHANSEVYVNIEGFDIQLPNFKAKPNGNSRIQLPKTNSNEINILKQPLATSLVKGDKNIEVWNEIYKPVLVIDNILFGYNKYSINKYKNNLIKLANYLKKEKEVKIEIRGYADAMGNDRYNLILSKRRAKIIKNYLVKLGVNENRLLVKGFGESNPIAYTNSKNKNIIRKINQYNRRVEFVILNQGKDKALCFNQINVPEKYKVLNYEPKLTDDSFVVGLRNKDENTKIDKLPDITIIKEGDEIVYIWGEYKTLTEVIKPIAKFKKLNIDSRVYMKIINDIDILDSHTQISEDIADDEYYNADNIKAYNNIKLSYNGGNKNKQYQSNRNFNKSTRYIANNKKQYNFARKKAAILINNIVYSDENKILDDNLYNLVKLSYYLKNNENAKIEIRSYTSNNESQEKNFLFSKRNVLKVCKFLVKNGVSKESFVAKAYGKKRLKANKIIFRVIRQGEKRKLVIKNKKAFTRNQTLTSL